MRPLARGIPEERRAILLVVAIAVAGILLVLIQTRFGPGASGDSTSYIMGAANLLSGNGFSRYSGGYEVKPITGFPPGYSAVLASLGLIGLDGFDASRLLNAILFGANIAIGGYLVFSYTRSTWSACIAAGLVLTADTMIELHSWVMSEPLYIFLTLAGVLALMMYLEGKGNGWLIAGALLTAFSTLTRYVGPALTASGVLTLLFFGRRSLTRRGIDALVFAVVSLLPAYLWLQRNAAVAGTLVNRELAYHPMEPGLLRLFLAEVSSWFVPHQVPLPTGVRAAMAVIIAGGLLGGFLYILMRFWTRREGWEVEIDGPPDARFRALPWLLTFDIGATLLILYINSTYLDASTSATAPPRYLAPVFAALVPLAVSAAHYLARREALQNARRWLAAGGAALLMALYALDSVPLIEDPISHMGYAGRRYSWSEAVAALKQIPVDLPIVSNNPEMLYILAGRPAYVRPISYDHYQQAFRQDYEQQFQMLAEQLEMGGVFVHIDQLEPDDEVFIERFDLQLSEIFDHLRVYRIPPPGS